jgi:diphosphomevalonate decarboxylase
MTDKNPETATAIAHPNIAFIKYWGNRDASLRLPANGSISMNLAELFTRTTVTFSPVLKHDSLVLNSKEMTNTPLKRVVDFLDIIRQLAKRQIFARIESVNNFPIGAGIASSAAAFSALALSASKAIGLDLDQKDLSRLARRGSGSACRSIPSGFVEWFAGTDDATSYAVSIAPPEYWALVDCIAIVRNAHKPTGSTEGHKLAGTSPLQTARVDDAARRLDACREAILTRDFGRLSKIVELDSNLMHAIMMTSNPALFYWEPGSLKIMKIIPSWRSRGLPVCYTLDAGPNVHVITTSEYSNVVVQQLKDLNGVLEVLVAHPGDATRLVEE